MSGSRPVALVTGASRGIGRAAALGLAAAGHDVAVNYASSKDRAQEVAREIEALGARAITVAADIADEQAVVAMFGEVERTFGRLDALANNAGTTIDTPPSDLDGLDMADRDRVFAVNVRGLFQVTQACSSSPPPPHSARSHPKKPAWSPESCRPSTKSAPPSEPPRSPASPPPASSAAPSTGSNEDSPPPPSARSSQP